MSLLIRFSSLSALLSVLNIVISRALCWRLSLFSVVSSLMLAHSSWDQRLYRSDDSFTMLSVCGSLCVRVCSVFTAGVMVSNGSRFGLYHGSVVRFSSANVGLFWPCLWWLLNQTTKSVSLLQDSLLWSLLYCYHTVNHCIGFHKCSIFAFFLNCYRNLIVYIINLTI